MKIRENSKTSIIGVSSLKEIIGRVILRKGGLPRFMVKYIIDDMVELGLLERLSASQYKVVESKCAKRIKVLIASYC